MSTCVSPDRLPSRTRGFSMVSFGGVATGALLAGSAEPTALFRLYSDGLHLTAPGLTLVFAAYAGSLLLALLTLGSLSDHVGRRPMISAGMLVSILAMLVFITADSLAALVAARLIQGLATGAALSALGAAMLDVDRARGALVSSIAPFLGMAVGLIAAAVLVNHAPHPAALIYAVTAALFLLLAVGVWFLPETAARHPGAWGALRPRVHVPRQARAMLLLITPVNTAAWALGGFYLSLMPGLLRASVGALPPVATAAVIAILPLAGSLSLGVLRNLPPARCIATGALGLALGIGLTLMGVYATNAALLIGGTLVAGLAFGAAFSGAVRGVFPLAGAAERAGLMAAYYVESYLAFSLPTVLAGMAVPVFGLHATAIVYGAVLMLLALASATAALRLRGPAA
ncbi:MFS transporter [Muricoccus aerilatus]|uniref:MFS transporter n=1 Tax=Muricoccus aerilatus TaxID=452982 RepID=UPI000AC768C9|nr:MFS transporter [Roseomonas aerilata]